MLEINCFLVIFLPSKIATNHNSAHRDKSPFFNFSFVLQLIFLMLLQYLKWPLGIISTPPYCQPSIQSSFGSVVVQIRVDQQLVKIPQAIWLQQPHSPQSESLKHPFICRIPLLTSRYSRQSLIELLLCDWLII